MGIGAAIAGLGIAGGVASSVIGSNAATDAAQTQANAANQASQTELNMFNQTQANEAPYLAAGNNALPALLNGLGIGGGNTTGTGSLNAPFTMQQFQNSPGYNFQLQQGENAVLNNASATGGVKSGNTLKALTQYGQGVANQDYWNAYNAYTTNQNTNFNRLQTIAGSGQNAAANLGSLGSQVASNVGANQIGAGNSISAGQVGSATAINNGINGVSSNYLLSSLLNGGGANNGFAGYDASTGTWNLGSQGFAP